jgi:hypothetical protein
MLESSIIDIIGPMQNKSEKGLSVIELDGLIGRLTGAQGGR